MDKMAGLDNRMGRGLWDGLFLRRKAKWGVRLISFYDLLHSKNLIFEALSEPELDEEEIRAMVKEIRQMSQKRAERLAKSEAKSKVILSEESKKRILEENLLSI